VILSMDYKKIFYITKNSYFLWGVFLYDIHREFILSPILLVTLEVT
jgi:hypothetical protein